MMMKYIWLAIFLMSQLVSGYSQNLQKQTDIIANGKDVVDGRFSFYAFNLDNGETVVAKNKNQRMIPASTLKLLSAYAALDNLGADYRFHTTIDYSGAVDASGVLRGDVYIRGGGDPVLGADSFKTHYEKNTSIIDQIAAAIAKAGIKKIEGRIIGDDTYFTGEPYPNDWVWEDIGNYYGAGSFGLSYRENKQNLFLNSSSTVGDTVVIDSTTHVQQGVTYQVMARSAKINSDQIYVYSPAYANYAIVRGEMPLSKKQFKVKAAIQDPALMIAQELQQNLWKRGVVSEDACTTVRKIDLQTSFGYEQMTNILVIDSPKLIDIITYMNLVSSNLIAEHLLKQLSVEKGDGSGSTSDGTEVVMKWMAKRGVDTKRIKIKDGSGLSHTNLVTTSWFVRLLAKMSMEPWFGQLKEALPTAGLSGSMRRIGKGTSIQNNMKAKTGYLDGARAYAGYVVNSKGENIAFCIMANDYACSASAMRKKMAELMVALYE